MYIYIHTCQSIDNKQCKGDVSGWFITCEGCSKVFAILVEMKRPE